MKNVKFRPLAAVACCAALIIGLVMFFARPAHLVGIGEPPLDDETHIAAPQAPPIVPLLPDIAGEQPFLPHYEDYNADIYTSPEPEAQPVAAALAPPAPTYLAALERSLDWLRESNPHPQTGSVGGEWSAIALARAGVRDDIWKERYLASLDLALAGQGEGRRQVLDYARIILALTALGLDASDHNGRDLTAPVREFAAGRQGLSPSVNAEIFALIALDSRPYEGSRTELIAAILASQASSGGWGLGGGTSPDITAMAIQALSPYYDANADVRAAIGRALELFAAAGSLRDAEANAQAIVAFTALGRDAGPYVEALLTFQDTASGAFTRGGRSDMMATEQAAAALAAYHRFMTGQNRLYDMSDTLGGR